jgi:alkenylglycerophosphocholine hydrolase
MKKSYLVIFILFSVLYGISLYLNHSAAGLIIKPVPLLVLIFSTGPVSRYNRNIFSGFILSLLGDIFLSHYLNLFIPGLVSFLIAHVFYIRAFFLKSSDPGIKVSPFFYACGVMIFIILQPRLGEMLVPVLIYLLVIVTMVWRSFMQRKVSAVSLYAFYGALLFFLSDTLIAFNLFASPFAGADFFIMGTYWWAQFLIYKSIDR